MTALMGAKNARADAVSVTAGRLNVRASASADSKAVTLVREGDTLQYICEANGWIGVAVGGKTGYVMKSYVSVDKNLIAEDVAATLESYSSAQQATASVRVNLRALPMTDSDALGVIGKGDAVSIVGRSGEWYRVTYGGKTGFVMGEFLLTGEEESGGAESSGSAGSAAPGGVDYSSAVAAVVNTRVNMRQSASTSASVLKVLGVNTSVSITGECGDWYKVSCAGKNGFIMKQFVSLAGQSGPADSGEVIYSAAVNAESSARVNLRAEAATSSSVLTVIARGETVSVTGEKGDFYIVRANGKDGYAAKAYFRLTGSSGSSGSSASSGASATTDVSPWTGVADVEINMRAEPEGEVLYVLKSGTEVTVNGVNGSWYRVDYRGTTGYVAQSYVSEKKSSGASGSTSGTTAYVTAASVNVRSGAGTGYAVVTTLRSGAELTIYELSDGWYRMSSSAGSGYISAKYVSTTKPETAPGKPSSGTSVGQVVESDWWTGSIQSVFKRGGTATVTDVETGLSFQVKRTGGTNHADAQPLTAADTAIMLQAYGGTWSWNRRAIWVTVGDTTYAASMNGMPHGETDSMPDNDFDGCFCIHFTNSRTHAGNRLDAAHQAAIKKALAAAK